MKRKLFSIHLALLLCMLLLPLTSLAADPASFTLTITNDKPEVGKEVQVTVKGQNLQDVYAYEVNFAYDEDQLRFKGAESAIQGFSVPPMLKKNRIQLATTKIGNISGESGDITLCTLTFEVIGEGKAAVELTDVKLVTSKLVSNVLKAGVQTAAEIQSNKSAAAFSDISGHWAREAIEKAAKLGFVNGYEDGTFHPQGLVNRSEFAVMLARALQLQENGSAQLSFTDLDSIPQWARPSISKAVAAGIVTGYEDDTFRPENMITRAEITAMIVRASGITVDPAKKPAFADADQIPEWADPFVAEAKEAGFIQGREGNLFAPNDHATRAEAVTLILSMLTFKS